MAIVLKLIWVMREGIKTRRRMSLRADFALDVFEKIWGEQKATKKEKEFAKFLLQNLAAIKPDIELKFMIDDGDGPVEASLLPKTPEPIKLPPTKEELLKRELEATKAENFRLKVAKAKKEGLTEELKELSLSMPSGLTVQEIAEKYTVSPQTVRNYVERLDQIGVRFSGFVGKPPAVYSETSITALAEERGWMPKLVGKEQVDVLKNKLEAQLDDKSSEG